MPIYEYQCSLCEKKIEALQKINDAPLKDCPVCFAPSLRKLVSAASFRLKGGGWYETDFKTGNKKKLAESDSSENKTEGRESKAPKAQSNKESTSVSGENLGKKTSEPGAAPTSGKNNGKI
ncbi:MAG: zinc ribbon domain-containing protein [Gammaproteobacteria bacterium]|nr:zinc ribbon domain-containing protein [Gammaproteobacteria bacterium]